MKNKNLTKLSFEELVDFYYDFRKGIFEKESEVLALKKLLFESDKNHSKNYLGMDPILDSMNYSKRFKEEINEYLPYASIAFFDKQIPSDLQKHLKEIHRKSKIKQRLIATRILDEHFYKKQLNTGDSKLNLETPYDLAVEYYFSTEENLRDMKEALHSSLCEVILNYPAQFQIKMLGIDNFLDAKLCEQEICDLKLENYFKEAQKLIKFDPSCTKEEKFYSLLEEIIEFPEEYISSLIAQKILPKYSVEKLKLMISEEENILDEEE